MKNFILGMGSTLLAVLLAGNLFWFFCPHAKRVYIKESPFSAVIEIKPMLMPIPQPMEKLPPAA